MKISVLTEVNQDYKSVFMGFTEHLFRKLNPPFPRVKVTRFDGCRTGDEVHIELDFLLFKDHWVSLITEQHQTDDEIYFIDQGLTLPFFLKGWQHKHRIMKSGENSVIADEIEYRTWNTLTDYLFYPVLYAQFLFRKPIYKSYFE